MTCAAAETWLLSARSVHELPDSVRAHLTECRGCAKRLAALTHTDAAVRRLAPEPNPAARDRLAEAIQRTPQASPAAPATPAPAPVAKFTRPLPNWTVGAAIGLAAAVLIAVGWLAGRLTAPRPVVQVPAPVPEQVQTPAPAPSSGPQMPVPLPPVLPPEGLPLAPHPSLPASLAARAARHAAHVAADPAPDAQAEALDEFAAAVRAEIIARASAGDAESLPRLTGLHERLLKLGVVRQVARTPEGKRAAVATRLTASLKVAADEVTTATGHLPPALGELVKPLAGSCRESAEAIQKGKTPLASSDWPSPPTPLEAVAAQTIRVARATDSLSRANECAQLASTLAASAAVLSAGGHEDDAGRVGESLATVLDAGVAVNLAHVEASDAGGALKQEVTLVRERTEKALEPLERGLAKPNPVAKPGLERVIIAVAPAHMKVTGKPPKHLPKSTPHRGPKK
jgi:hypothetical protein